MIRELQGNEEEKTFIFIEYPNGFTKKFWYDSTAPPQTIELSLGAVFGITLSMKNPPQTKMSESITNQQTYVFNYPQAPQVTSPPSPPSPPN